LKVGLWPHWPNKAPRNRTSKNADDIVITLALRTPLTKARKGGLKDSSLEYISFVLLEEVRKRSNIDPGLVEDICLGNVRPSKSSYNINRKEVHC
jgi:acetyl-CoA acyltransferase 1